MDYISIIAIGTLVSSFFSGFVLGKILRMRLLAQLITGNFFLFTTALIIEIVGIMTGYNF